jgi:hypothetical protein
MRAGPRSPARSLPANTTEQVFLQSLVGPVAIRRIFGVFALAEPDFLCLRGLPNKRPELGGPVGSVTKRLTL